MTSNNPERRNQLKALIGMTAIIAVWKKPVVNTLLLPAHAQTTEAISSTFIQASSLDANNTFSRFILIVDDSDQVLANCGESGGTALADNLSTGIYRIFADSEGPQQQLITVSTSAQSLDILVDTNTDHCNFLVATVNLPQGSIIAASGEKIPGPWDCNTNFNTMCL